MYLKDISKRIASSVNKKFKQIDRLFTVQELQEIKLQFYGVFKFPIFDYLRQLRIQEFII